MGSKPSIRVVAAVIRNEGRFLITQRRPGAVLPLLWEFPGGQVEDGESDAHALQREVRERLDVEIEIGAQMSIMQHEYPRYLVTLVIFAARLPLGQHPRVAHIHDFRWVPSDDFDRYEFPPADQATMDQLLGMPNESLVE
ncbi:MAG: (deoxy)nucleoside triphosphate pyrophosphohydrolase [Deltaproteobacteria bacterium]|nr:(deoxy)nucleoside triphosphate pyrophosphohydrolase [Deltaproteobacteria bacterium]